MDKLKSVKAGALLPVHGITNSKKHTTTIEPASTPQHPHHSTFAASASPAYTHILGGVPVQPVIYPPQYSALPNVFYPNQMEENSEPLYVNAKQYHRILKRREARAKLEIEKKLQRRKKYQHESRHKHAMRRPRGPGGRFLSSQEIAALQQEGKLPKQDTAVAAGEPASIASSNGT
ncbi:uncharacterized protein VTP21DRAFT_5404 [Calcarisporiella thermophila]|uniref:uncharacterized protein n=1 Tax=Calcarisporiella thermophila TaxID=911321 RepID=UPI0037428D15